MAASDIGASIIAHIIIIPYMWQGHLSSEVQYSFLQYVVNNNILSSLLQVLPKPKLMKKWMSEPNLLG